MGFLCLLWKPRRPLDLDRDTPHAATGTGFAACKRALVESRAGCCRESPRASRHSSDEEQEVAQHHFSCGVATHTHTHTHWDEALAASIYFPQEKLPSVQ